MNNFEKPLQDAADEELMQWINTRNPTFTTLASDELSRRQSRRLETSNRNLQLAMLVLTCVTTFMAVTPVIQSLLNFLFKIYVSASHPNADLSIRNISFFIAGDIVFAVAYFMHRSYSAKMKMYSHWDRFNALNTKFGIFCLFAVVAANIFLIFISIRLLVSD